MADPVDDLVYWIKNSKARTTKRKQFAGLMDHAGMLRDCSDALFYLADLVVAGKVKIHEIDEQIVLDIDRSVFKEVKEMCNLIKVKPGQTFGPKYRP